MEDYKNLANQVYPTFAKVKKFQKWVASEEYIKILDQEWADEYLQPLADFMGDPATINSFFPSLSISDRTTLRTDVNVPSIGFSHEFGSSGHWYARKPGDKKAFDPYNEYQVLGTNQFCQTYSIMYHANRIPPKISGQPWTKYYSYTLSALQFIKDVIQTLPADSPAFKGKTNQGMRVSKQKMLSKVNMCLSYPNMCVNIIEYPRI
jgi:hypothetical protein